MTTKRTTTDPHIKKKSETFSKKARKTLDTLSVIRYSEYRLGVKTIVLGDIAQFGRASALQAEG